MAGLVARRFWLRRDTDVTGYSGRGIVAEGIQWDDGTVALHWRGDHRSTVIWRDMAGVMAVHGHDGATRVVWVDKLGIELPPDPDDP